jgi:secreted trypsin-like serine protease
MEVVTDFEKFAARFPSDLQGDLKSFVVSAQSGKNICHNVFPKESGTPFFGDSGGPVFVDEGPGPKMLMSVVSQGLVTDQKEAPASAVGLCGPHLGHYADWIVKQMGK